MKKSNKILSAALALVMCLSLLPMSAFAATVPEQLLEPGKEEYIDPVDEAAQELIDKTYDALNPDADPTQSKGEIIGEDGKVTGDVLDQADAAQAAYGDAQDAANTAQTQFGTAEAAGEAAKTEVQNALKVGEDKTDIGKYVADEADKASEALEAAKEAADAAAEAAATGNQTALTQARDNAEKAAQEAEAAYNNAQTAFDEVIGNLLTEEELAEVIAKAEEDGTDVNAAKLAAANAKIEEKYATANGQIDAANGTIADANGKIADANDQISEAKTALETALKALENADKANKEAKALVDQYAGWTNTGAADDAKAGEIYDAYKEFQGKKDTADTAMKAADAKEPEGSTADTPEDRIERDSELFKSDGSGLVDKTDVQLIDAVKVAASKMETIEKCLEQLETETDESERDRLWNEIKAAEDDIYKNNYKYGALNIPTLRSPYEMISDRYKNASAGYRSELKATLDRLMANLDAAKAGREQLKAKEAFNKSIAGLDAETALKVVKALGNTESYPEIGDLKDAADAYKAAKDAAAEAAQKAADAQAVYEAAQKAVADALENLKNLENLDTVGNVDALDAGAFDAAKAELADALAKLDEAKQKKDEANEQKQIADEQVITIIEDIIGGGDDVEIDDVAVPLASGPVTRAEFIDYLWRHEGEPEGGVCTFTDVPADHDYVLALGWAQANGIAVAYEDGSFEPDELVTVAAVRELLGNFAEAFGTNAVDVVELTTLTGDDDEAVLNCDEILAEFFGEEYAAGEIAA